jgi:hypothetical protein
MSVFARSFRWCKLRESTNVPIYDNISLLYWSSKTHILQQNYDLIISITHYAVNQRPQILLSIHFMNYRVLDYVIKMEVYPSIII